MQRYAQWLLAALKARGVTVLLIRPVPFFSKLAKGPLHKQAVIKYLGYLDKYLIFPGQLRKAAKQFDLVHICDHSNSMYVRATAGVPNLITCHDVLAIRSARGEFTATSTGWSGRLLQSWILSVLKQAQNILCVSEKTKSDLLRLTGNTGAKVEVVLNPLNWPYKPQPNLPATLKSRLGLAEEAKYFLHVGGNQWYKNRPAAVEIFHEIVSMQEFASTKLILAGKSLPASLKSLIDELKLSGSVIPISGTSNEELEALYSNALALIFPSLEEGFGWPIAEAHACGCPVATTNRPPMTEVAGKAAILFDPTQPKAAAEAIRQGLFNRASLIAAGIENVKRFEESKIIEQYRKFYLDILRP